jgi:hypothetical protein
MACEFDLFAGFQVGEGDQNVVAGIKLENGAMHRLFPGVHRDGHNLVRPIAPGHCNALGLKRSAAIILMTLNER